MTCFFGVNPDGCSEGETAAPWANPWCQVDWHWQAPTPGKPVPQRLSADGYPQDVPGKTVSAFANYPLGDYPISFTGDGAITPDGCFVVKTPPVRDGKGVWRGVWAKTSMGGCGITVTPGPTDTLHGIRLLRPGCQPGDVWAPDYIKALQFFGVLRFLDFTKTNFSPLKEWADRITPEQFGYSGPRGVPLEALCDLTTRVGREAWFPIPHGFSDDAARKEFQFIRDHTPKEIRKRFSFSNEVWNKSMGQFHDLHAVMAPASTFLGLKPIPAGQTMDLQRTYEYVGHRNAQLAKIMREVFPSPAEAVWTYDGWMIDSEGAWALDVGMAQVAAHYGKPADLFDAVSEAPYFGTRSQYDNIAASPTPEAMLANMTKELTDWYVPLFTHRLAQVKALGLRMVGYEAGVGLILDGSNGPLDQVKKAVQTHPGLGVLYKLWHATVLAPYFEWVCHLSFIGSNPMWALQRNLADPPSVKMQAVRDLQPALPPPITAAPPVPLPPPPPPLPPPPVMPVPAEGSFVGTLNGKTINLKVQP